MDNNVIKYNYPVPFPFVTLHKSGLLIETSIIMIWIEEITLKYIDFFVTIIKFSEFFQFISLSQGQNNSVCTVNIIIPKQGMHIKCTNATI